MTLRMIQVGMGGWGRNWTKNIVSENKDVELVACVDISPEMLALAQAELSLPASHCFTSLDDTLTQIDCDAVLVTAALAGHVPSALMALEAGKHVLLEKPFASTLAEAQRVVETADRSKRILMISQNYRYYPAVQAVKELVREGELGPVGSVALDFRYDANKAPYDPKGSHYNLWQPLLVDMAIHHFDLMRYVLGQNALSVTCQTWNPAWSNFREDAEGAAIITFDGGTVVSYRGSWVSPGPRTSWAGEWHMACEGGEVVWSSRDNVLPDSVTLRPSEKRTRHLKLPDYPDKDRHGSLRAFVEAVTTGQQPESSGRDNLKTLALMLSAVESAQSGKPIHVTEVD